MKLFPHSGDHTVYQDGFGDTDPFGRKAIGERLSALVENVEDPLVIAVDGSWGTGKTHFLRRWVGAHGLENNGKATTVYFDAFAHDFLEDPLVSLTSAIGARFPSQEKSEAWSTVKKYGASLARPASRLGLAAITAGASELVGVVGDAVLATGKDQLDEAAKRFWEQEDAKQKAMRLFAASLEEFSREKPSHKLAIVIDELDRCRPDYALMLLETIKHFFAVPNVIFVLGVNQAALESSVRARYGVDFDAGHYLHRFISLTLNLPEVGEHERMSFAAKHLVQAGAQMGLDVEFLQLLGGCAQQVSEKNLWSMRAAERLLTFTALASASRDLGRLTQCYRTLVALGLLMKALKPSLYSKVVRRQAGFLEIKSFIGLGNVKVGEGHSDAHKYQMHGYLALIMGVDEEFPEGQKEHFMRGERLYLDNSGPDELARILTMMLDEYNVISEAVEG